MSSSVLFEESGGVAKVTLNKPDIRNAFAPEMIEELTKIFRSLSRNHDISAVILAGEGISFCAGADLSWMKSMADFSEDENQADSAQLFEMFETIRNCPIPIIGKIHGHAMGGALGLISVCDLVAAQRETKFCFSEVKLGLTPAVISPFVLRKLSLSHALEVMLTAEVFTAEKAYEIGLVHFVGSPEEVEDYVLGKSDILKTVGKEAVRATKSLLNYSTDHSWSEVREESVRTIAERRVSDEGQEGLKAFFEKRRPSWRV